MSECRREMSPRRRRLVVLAGSLGSISASGAALSRPLSHHHAFMVVWLLLLAAAITYVIVELVRLRKEEAQ